MNERAEQVNHLLKAEVGTYLQEHLVNHQGVLTVTAVETTGDLRLSTVWFGYVGSDLGTVTTELRKNSRQLQQYINKRLSMKNVPRIVFKYDNSGDYAIDITKIIDEANRDSKTSK
jgi:ribosome-binding factor A